VPATIEDIFSGRACEAPRCMYTPSRQCPCCRAALCATHVVSGFSEADRGRNATVIKLKTRQSRRDDLSLEADVTMHPRNGDFCGMCAAEDMSVVRQVLVARCQKELRFKSVDISDRKPWEPDSPVFEIPLTLPRKARDSVRQNVRETIRHTVGQVKAKISDIPFSTASCNRVQFANISREGYGLVRKGRRILRAPAA
jgi:hypothetical protein